MGRCALGLGLSSSSGLMSHMGLVTAIRPSPSSALGLSAQFADGQQDFTGGPSIRRKALAWDILSLKGGFSHQGDHLGWRYVFSHSLDGYRASPLYELSDNDPWTVALQALPLMGF